MTNGTKKDGLTPVQYEILRILNRALERADAGDGVWMRDTNEVAERLAITTAKARNVLYQLAEKDLVDVYEDSPIVWKITPAGRAALGGNADE